MRTRSFVERKAQLFWEVSWEAGDVEVVSGAIGAPGRATTRAFTRPAEADAWVEGAIAQKLRAGFEEVDPPGVEPAAEPTPAS